MAAFYNQATLSYSGGVVNSNITTGEILEILSVTKTAVVDEYSFGTDVTYVINLINSGTTPITGLTLTDDLGAYTLDTQSYVPMDYVIGSVKYFVDGVLEPTPAVTQGPPLTISGISVEAGNSATIVYTARTNNYASPEEGSGITNTVTVSGGGISPVEAQATVNVSVEPVLSIVKSVSPSAVAENGELTYTFEIINRGNAPADATDNVSVTDVFDPVLSNISVSYNGTPWVSPTNYTYDENTGIFTTVPGAITVPEATYTRDESGEWNTVPSLVTLTVTGTV